MLLQGLRVELEPTVREHLRLGQVPGDRPLNQLVRMMAAPIPRPSPWNDSIGPFYDTAGVRHLLGVTCQALAQQRTRRTILALETPDRHLLYPTLQSDEHRRVLPGLSDVLAAVPAGAFVERAVRNELERARARRFLDRLDAELGPVDESLVEHFDSLFAEVDAASGIG